MWESSTTQRVNNISVFCHQDWPAPDHILTLKLEVKIVKGGHNCNISLCGHHAQLASGKILFGFTSNIILTTIFQFVPFEIDRIYQWKVLKQDKLVCFVWWKQWVNFMLSVSDAYWLGNKWWRVANYCQVQVLCSIWNTEVLNNHTLYNILLAIKPNNNYFTFDRF